MREVCARKTFTGSLPQVPPGCRETARLREQAGGELAERGITPAEGGPETGECRLLADRSHSRKWLHLPILGRDELGYLPSLFHS